MPMFVRLEEACTIFLTFKFRTCLRVFNFNQLARQNMIDLLYMNYLLSTVWGNLEIRCLSNLGNFTHVKRKLLESKKLSLKKMTSEIFYPNEPRITFCFLLFVFQEKKKMLAFGIILALVATASAGKLI